VSPEQLPLRRTDFAEGEDTSIPPEDQKKLGGWRREVLREATERVDAAELQLAEQKAILRRVRDEWEATRLTLERCQGVVRSVRQLVRDYVPGGDPVADADLLGEIRGIVIQPGGNGSAQTATAKG